MTGPRQSGKTTLCRAAFPAQRNPSRAVTTRVVYGGVMRQSRGPAAIIPWHSIDREQWHGDIVGS